MVRSAVRGAGAGCQAFASGMERSVTTIRARRKSAYSGRSDAAGQDEQGVLYGHPAILKGPMRLVLILAAIGTLSAAQSVPTWGDLRFGMTEAQVRSVLGPKMLAPTPGPEHQPADKSSHNFIGGIVQETSVKGFDGEADLIFDKGTKKLSLVSLMLTPKRELSNQEKLLAYSRLRDDLVKKYGPPVSVKDDATIFLSGGQSIDVFAPPVEWCTATCAYCL